MKTKQSHTTRIWSAVLGLFVISSILTPIYRTELGFSPKSASSDAYSSPVFVSGINSSLSSAIIGGYENTFALDNIYQTFKSQAYNDWGKKALVEVVYNVPVCNASNLRIAAQALEIHHNTPTGGYYPISIVCFNQSDKVVFSAESLSPDSTQNFPKMEIAKIKLRANTHFWYGGRYSIWLRIDLLELNASYPNQVPVCLTPLEVIPLTAQIGAEIRMVGGDMHDPDGEITPIMTYYAWEFQRGNNIQSIPNATARQLTVDSNRFEIGDQIRGKVWAIDSLGASSGITVSNWVPIVNTAPIITNVEIVSNSSDSVSIYRSSLLTCIPMATDPNPNQSITFSYAWFRNQELIVGANSDQLLLTRNNSSVGDLVTCSVRANDGDTVSDPVNASGVILNRIANISGPVLISPSCPTSVSDLTVQHAIPIDLDQDSVAVTYAFFQKRDSNPYTLIQESNSPVLSSAFLQDSDLIYAVVIVNDSFTPNKDLYIFQTPEIMIHDQPPIIQNLEMVIWNQDRSAIITNPLELRGNANFQAKITVQMTGNTSTIFADFYWYLAQSPDPLQVSKNVLVNNSMQSEDWLNALTLRLKHGDAVYFIAIVKSGALIGEAEASNLSLIRNSLPIITHAQISPSSISKAQDISIIIDANDLDHDPIFYQFEYYIDNTLDSAHNTSILPSSAYRHGQHIFAKVRPYNVYGSLHNYGEWISTETITVENCLPDVSLALNTPIFVDTKVKANWSVFDADKDGYSMQWNWYKNGQLLQETADQLSSTNLQSGDIILCILSVNDSFEPAIDVTVRAAAVVHNSAPVLVNCSIGIELYDRSYPSLVFFYDDILSIRTSTQDLNLNDNQTLHRRWYRNGVEIPEARDLTQLNQSYFAINDEIFVKVAVFDGNVESNWMQCAPVYITTGSRYALFDYGKIITMQSRLAYSLLCIFAVTFIVASIIIIRQRRARIAQFYVRKISFRTIMLKITEKMAKAQNCPKVSNVGKEDLK